MGLIPQFFSSLGVLPPFSLVIRTLTYCGLFVGWLRVATLLRSPTTLPTTSSSSSSSHQRQGRYTLDHLRGSLQFAGAKEWRCYASELGGWCGGLRRHTTGTDGGCTQFIIGKIQDTLCYCRMVHSGGGQWWMGERRWWTLASSMTSSGKLRGRNIMWWILASSYMD